MKKLFLLGLISVVLVLTQKVWAADVAPKTTALYKSNNKTLSFQVIPTNQGLNQHYKYFFNNKPLRFDEPEGIFFTKNHKLYQTNQKKYYCHLL